MISAKYRFIYIHYPKTGGNTINSVFLPFSDDHTYTERHQEGSDRFEVKGPVTPEKHASLQDYADILADELSTYRVVVSIRHPFERIISAYFSPHKWLEQTNGATWNPIEPFWDEARFERLLTIKYQRAAVEYLTVQGSVQQPDLIIHKERFKADLDDTITALGLPRSKALTIPHVNVSAAAPGLIRKVLSSRELRDRIEDHYRADMEFFAYPPYDLPT